MRMGWRHLSNSIPIKTAPICRPGSGSKRSALLDMQPYVFGSVNLSGDRHFVGVCTSWKAELGPVYLRPGGRLGGARCAIAGGLTRNEFSDRSGQPRPVRTGNRARCRSRRQLIDRAKLGAHQQRSSVRQPAEPRHRRNGFAAESPDMMDVRFCAGSGRYNVYSRFKKVTPSPNP